MATKTALLFHASAILRLLHVVRDVVERKVAKVVSLMYTFYDASKFTGTGLRSWDVANVHRDNMRNIFYYSSSLTTCNKRKIADAWKSSAVFVATDYDTDWAADTCPVRFE